MSFSSSRSIYKAIQASRNWSLVLGLLLLAALLCPSQGFAAGIVLVQHRSLDAGTTTTSSLAFTNSNTAGNWIGVCIRAGISSSQVFTVTDTNGNTYHQAAQIGFTAAGVTMAIYYAENIKSGANTIIVSDTVTGPIRTAILEYSGVATSNSLDAFAKATGTSASPNSGNATTTVSGDLLLGAVGTTNGATFTAGSGYKIEELVPVTPNPKLIAEDQIQTSAGIASASASIATTDTWGAILAAFQAASSGSTAPSITSLNPTSGPVGASITIAGANFGASQSGSTVTFNGTPVTTVSSWSANSIAVSVPTGATTGNVVVTVGGVLSNGVLFTVTPPPSITSLSPASGPVSTSVTIAGANFGASQSSTTVTFNGTPATPTSWSATSIMAPVPTGATTGNVVVTLAGVASNGVAFTVTTAPAINSLNPTSGPVGASVTIAGANFGASQSGSTVTFNGTPVTTVSSWSATSIVAAVPAGATTGNVVVTVGGLLSNSVLFTVTPPPTITSLSPISGPVGTSVMIAGANFGASQSGSTVTFNGTPVTTVSSWSATSIVALVPTGATTGNVVVTLGGVASNGMAFTVTVPPVNIVLVQHRSLDAGTTTSSSLAFVSPNTVGNWIGVCIRAGISSSQVFTVTDSNGNTYHQAAQIGFTAAGVTMAIYYAESIKGGANTVTVADTVAGPLRTGILEYSGVATSNSRDVTAAATGTSASPNSGNATTTVSGDLLLGAVGTTNGATFTAGSGYKIEELVPVTPNPKLIAEDQIQTSAGLASASASIAATDTWGAILAAFKVAGGGGGTGPTISSLSQTTGAVGASITITGTNFGASIGSSTVTFNGTTAAVSNWSATSIITSVPAGATTGPVVVTMGGVPSNGVTFTVIPAPSITSLSVTSGPIGTSVTVTGTNFGASQGTSTVTFNGISGTPTSWSATSIVVPVPNGATTGNVVVTVSGASSNGVLFTVTSPGPSISSLSLTQGPIGATLTVNGSNFGSTQGNSTVTFNGVTATATSNWSAANFNVTVPSGATTGNVLVTVGGVLSNGVLFTVTPPPSIISISPTSGPIGTNVIITGTNFGPTVGTIQSFVTFNGTQTRASNWSDTSITAPAPTGATTGNVLVSVGGVPSNGVLFTVTPAPSISTLTPTFGPVGTSVTIAGANFGGSQLSSTVTFNGTTASPTFWSATSIMAPVPAGATSGNVVVTESGVASNGVNYTVTSGSGNIALVQHRNLDAGTTTSGSLAFTSNNTAGNWIAVCVRAGTTTSEVFTITDSQGNTYHQAFQFSLSPSAVVFALYYAENIKGGANNVIISDTVSGPLRFAISEYSGIATSNSLDAVPVTASGGSATPNSGSLTTGANGDLLLGIIVTPNGDNYTAGSGYIIEDAVPALPSTKLIVEDQIQAQAGPASATASLSPSDNWGAGLAAFRSISGIGFPISVSVSPSTVSLPTGYGTQAFTATVTNDFQNRGATWSLSGAGCSGSTCGFLSNVTTTSVTYTAPANMPSPASVSLTATAVGDNTKSASATITVTPGVLTIVLSPKRAAVTLSASQSVQFTDTVYNDPQNLGVTWQVDGNNSGNVTTGTVSTTGLFTPGTQFGSHTVTAVSNYNASVNTSSPVAVTDLPGVYTHHNDNARTGQNLQEYGLTPAMVTSATFGQLFSCPVDGYVYAEPLWVAHQTVGATIRNVVFIATEHDSVYAFDADSPSCVQLWKVSFLGTGVTTLVPSDLGGNGDIVPEVGTTSTPVIDPATNTIYVFPKTKETVGTQNGQTCTTSSPCFVHRLHALDLATGAEKFGGPMVISATNFLPFWHLQRPALTLANNTIYIAFGSHGDHTPYYGWVMGYDPATLAQKFVTTLTDATGNSGLVRGGVWGSGAGPAVDASGNVYVSTGNGNYDGSKNFGDSAIKLSPTGAILDWFTPFNQSVFNANDIDLGSGGIIILPDTVGSAAHQHLAIATGKVAILYLLDQTNMGKFNSSTNNDVQEVIPVPPANTTLLDGGNYGIPAYWNNNIYTTGQNFPLSQFTIANGSGSISTPQTAKSTNTFPPRGGIPAVSANGAVGGVVWIIDYTGWQNGTAAILDAYDATNVGTLLFSSAGSGAGSIAPAVKWSVPTVANGRVYVGAQYSFSVFGLKPN